MSPRILQVVTDTDRRGAQVFACDLHAAMESAGRCVSTVALGPGQVGGLELRVLGPKRMSPSSLRALRAEVRRADVVIAHGSTTLPACAIATLGTQVPFVYRQISDSRFWAPTRLRRLRVRVGMSRAAHVVALWSGSAETVSELFGVPPSRVSVVPNGVPVTPFGATTPQRRAEARRAFGLAENQATVLSLGALAPEKGVDLTIRAVGSLPNVSLLVVGDGPERQALEALAQENARGRVVFTGSIETPLSAYSAADAIVLPSRGGDSMPAVLIEAGLCELPAITTPIEGIPEIVVDSVTGVIVPCDDFEAVADGLQEMFAAPQHMRAMGERAREHCLRHFSISVVAEKWLEVLDAVVEKRQS